MSPALAKIPSRLASKVKEAMIREMVSRQEREAKKWEHVQQHILESIKPDSTKKDDDRGETRHESQTAGLLLNKYVLIGLLVGLMAAAWNGLVVVVILLSLVLSAAIISKLWSHFSLVGVSCQRELSGKRAFPGESIELKLRLVNRKILPLPWIQIDDEIPIGFVRDITLSPGKRPGFGILSRAAALLWYTAISWRQSLFCHKRGYYKIGPITVTSGDIFGFYPRLAIEPIIDHIIVYPRIFPIAQLGIPSIYPIGETKAERRIFADPTRVIGVREYNYHDSLKYIHWKATARHQNLQVKVFEPTTTTKVALFLAVESFKYNGTYSEEDFELGISTVASITDYVIGQGSQVGVYVNTHLAESGQPIRIMPGSGTNQLVYILESLAKITPYTSSSFEELLEDEEKSLPWGTTLIFVLAKPSELLSKMLNNLGERGHKVLVLQVGDTVDRGAARSISWHHIKDYMT